jgi:hypothetical protein
MHRSDLGVLGVLATIPSLQTLTLAGNPLANAADPANRHPPLLPNYRCGSDPPFPFRHKTCQTQNLSPPLLPMLTHTPIG